MEKKKCEICGQMKPQNEFSKSYKHRCKACVAEAARNNRKQFLKLEREVTEALINGNQIIPAMESPTTYLPNPRYIIATHAMQGILASEKVMSLVFASMRDVKECTIYETVAITSIAFADALMKKLKDKKP